MIYVDTVKYTLKQFNLPCKGKKKDLIESLVRYYRKNYYEKNIDKIIFIQKQFRKKYEKLEFVNKEDFYTLEPLNKIKKQFLFYYIDNSKYKYGFDIRSLNILIQKSNINPYNRNVIPDNIIKIVKQKIKELKKNKIDVNIEEEIPMNEEQKMINRIVNIFQKIDDLAITASGTDISWFTSLSFLQLKKLYRVLEDIWNYRAQISQEQKHRIVPGNNIFRYNIPYILNLTPNYSYYLKKIILDEIDKLISSGIDIENQKLGAYYVLIGFTEVSYECSQSLPWLSQN